MATLAISSIKARYGYFLDPGLVSFTAKFLKNVEINASSLASESNFPSQRESLWFRSNPSNTVLILKMRIFRSVLLALSSEPLDWQYICDSIFFALFDELCVNSVQAFLLSLQVFPTSLGEFNFHTKYDEHVIVFQDFLFCFLTPKFKVFRKGGNLLVSLLSSLMQ